MLDQHEVGTPKASGKRTLTGTAKAPQGVRAVFVAHGMGQQVPFATLDDVARGICANAQAKVQMTRARTVRVGCEVVQRLEIEFENDKARPIHVFEAYWAPLTEGAVGLWQVVRFLLLGGFNGIRSGGRFCRFLFGRDREFKILPSHMTLLLLAIVVILSIVITGWVVAIVGAAVLLQRQSEWISPGLVRDLTAAFELLLAILLATVIVSVVLIALSRRLKPLAAVLRGLAAAVGVILAAAFVLTAYVRIPLSILFNTTMPFEPLAKCVSCAWTEGPSVRATVGRFLRWLHQFFLQLPCISETWAWRMLLVAAVVLLAIAVFSAVRRRKPGVPKDVTDAHRYSGGRWWVVALAIFAVVVVVALCGRSDAVALATWVVLLGFVLFVRSFLIQYVGDVAAYVSPHVVDRFFDLRQRIKDRVWRAARAVYALRDEATGAFVYDEIAVVGHSLGAVIVYDTLNRLLNDDVLAKNASPHERCGDVLLEDLQVSRRTKLLLTFGCPLDKTAFIFAMHDRGGGTNRDALATSVQPLIKDHRTLAWINLWSRWDILCGQLDFYDTPEKDNPNLVDNRMDTAAVTPLAAHVEYWKGPMIYRAILEHLPA